MMSKSPIVVDASGRFLAPPQTVLEARPAGPWQANGENPRAALRGADVREALAGELPIRVAGILRRLFNEDPVSAEELAELANGRRV